MGLKFDKYHGIGNDFLVIEVNDPALISVERAKRLCARHFGVGGDGVLVVSPAGLSGVRAKMTVINSDGSIPEMCGNGLRCVALHLARRSARANAEFVVETGAGPLLCSVSEGDAKKAMVGTEMGQGTPMGELSSPVTGEPAIFHRLNTGNPHAICFRSQISSAELDVVGPAVSSLVQGGANVEIATIHSPSEITVTVWERGVGRTLACGTGAAATAIEAVRQGRCPPNTPITVQLPGGPLTITVSDELSAYLRGSAEWVYSGETDL